MTALRSIRATALRGITSRFPRPTPFSLAFAVLFGAYCALAVLFVFLGRMNEDEGWYLYASRLVYEGRLPYRDFAFFQAPLLPYVYGLPQLVFGGSLDVGRWTSFCLSIATVTLGARLAYERGGRLAALLFVSIFSLTPIALWSFTTTRTEPLTTPLLMVAALLLLRPPGRVASAGALVAVALAAAARVTLVPAALAALVWVTWKHWGERRRLLPIVLPSVLVASAFLIVAMWPDAEAARFNVVTVQAERHGQLQPAEAWDLGDALEVRSANVLALSDGYGFVPALSLAAVAVAVVVLFQRHRGGTLPPPAAAEALLVLFAAVAYVPHLAPRFVVPEYFAPVFPLFLVVIASWTGQVFRRLGMRDRQMLLGAIAGLLVFQAATFFTQIDVHLSGGDPDLRELDTVARFLERNVPEDGYVLTMDAYLAVESNRTLVPGWEMSVFSYFPRRSEGDADRFHVITSGRVDSSLASGSADAVALTDTALGLLVRQRPNGYAPGRVLTEAELHTALPALRGYHLAKTFAKFGQFEDTLYILLPERQE